MILPLLLMMQLSVPPDTSALQAQIAAAQTAAAQALANGCQPASVIPPTEAVGGSAGSGNQCRLANAVQPRITRAGLAVTDASNNWSVTWSTPLASPPATLPIPMNTGAQPIECNVTTSTTTGATGQCWVSRTLPATILSITALLNYNLFGGSSAGIVVQVFAIPMTQ